MTNGGSKRALQHFKRVDPTLYKATKMHHASLPSQLPRKRTAKALFERLIQTVVSQQLGTGATRSIFARVRGVCGGVVTSSTIDALSPARLKGAGLSGAKVKTLKALARAVESQELDLLGLPRLPIEEAVDNLLKVWGIGPWSVEMFLMFGLGLEDVFSIGDLGLVRSVESIYKLPKDTPHTSLLAISEKWAPYRTYASLLLWKTRDAQKVT